MVAYQHVRMDLMSSKQVSQYLTSSDLVILPVGCFEMHGPGMPLACDTFHAWASALLLADEWSCLCLPPVNYTFPGASGPWPGTVDISPDVSVAYLRDIVKALIKGGFKRVVMYGTHAPLSAMFQMVMRSIFQDSGDVVIGMQSQMLPDDQMQQQLGYTRGEDILLAASMRILQLDGVYDPSLTEVDLPQEYPLAAIGKLAAHGARVPWMFAKDYQHTGLRSCIKPDDIDKAIEIMKQSAQKMSDVPESFAEYAQQIAQLCEEKPWLGKDAWSQ